MMRVDGCPPPGPCCWPTQGSSVSRLTGQLAGQSAEELAAPSHRIDGQAPRKAGTQAFASTAPHLVHGGGSGERGCIVAGMAGPRSLVPGEWWSRARHRPGSASTLGDNRDAPKVPRMQMTSVGCALWDGWMDAWIELEGSSITRARVLALVQGAAQKRREGREGVPPGMRAVPGGCTWEWVSTRYRMRQREAARCT